MTNDEKKKYILNNWNTSSGKRISEMLKRYFMVKDKPPEESTYSVALSIFQDSKNDQTVAKYTP